MQSTPKVELPKLRHQIYPKNLLMKSKGWLWLLTA
jgi:hypothetical protein